jgi:tRNA A-37 threonylcarbamoyl transferase component Bud32
VHDSYLLTRSIPGSHSFAEYLALLDTTLSDDERPSARLPLMRQLADLCARAHQAGVEHDDFHIGNILVQPAAGVGSQPVQLYMIDLPGVRLRQTLGWRRSRESLATLITGLLFRCDVEELETLCRSYLAARPDLGRTDAVESTRLIIRRGRQLARQVLRRRDQRALRTNRHYVASQFDGTRLHTIATLDPARVYAEIGDGAAPLRDFIARPWKLTHASVVLEGDLHVAAEPIRVAYKRCRVTRPLKLLLAPLRRSRAVDAWYRANALASRGIATPRPIMAVEPPRPHRWRDSYLATEWITGVMNLHLFAWGLADLPPEERLAEANICAERLGQLIGRMHHWCVSHRDLKACNLLIAGSGAAIECHVVDPDGVRIRRRITTRRRARDLSRLATSMAAHPWLQRTTLMRFIRGFVSEQHDDVLDWKRLWRTIARQSVRAVARKRERGDIVA